MPLVVYWLILFIATTIPTQKLPSIGFNDKLIHFIAYFVLAIYVNLTMIYQRKSILLFEKAPLATIIICLFYGAVDELHQMLVPGRSAEALDWVADAIGVVFGVFTVYFLINRLGYRLEFN